MSNESDHVNYSQRNRQARRGVDARVARQSYWEIVLLGAVLVVVLAGNGLMTALPNATIGLAILLALVSAVRAALVFTFHKSYAHGARIWFQRFVAAVYTHLALWSVLTGLVAIYSTDPQEVVIVIVANVGLAATTSLTWSRLFRANLGRLTLLMLPTPIALLATFEPWYMVTGFLITCFYLVLLHQTEIINTHFWTMVESNRQLGQKSRELESMITEVQEAANVKSHFISNVTREIRTPMTNVVGMLSLLADTGLTEEQLRLQAIALRSSEALLSLIDDILDFSRLSAGTLSLGAAVYDVRSAAEDAVEVVAPAAYERGLELALVVDADVPVRVRSDRVRFVQLLRYLLMNAIENSLSGEIKLALSTHSESDEKIIMRIEVHDQGAGISEAQRNLIFEPFVTTVDDDQVPSLGLGLALARALIEKMKGEIGVESQEGVGSMFWVNLPLFVSPQPVASKPIVDLLDHQRVLLVGAGPSMVESVREYFSGVPITLDAIEGEARAKLRLESTERDGRLYDLVMFNVSPAEVSGVERIADIVNQWPDLPIAVLCALDQQGDHRLLQLAKDAGRVLFVNKPFNHLGAREVLQLFNDAQRPIPEAVVQDEWRDEASYRILVVEDNKVNQLVIAGMLANLGYRVSLASSGLQALMMLEDRVFSLVIMDLVMPDMDGFEAATQIRQIANGQNLPILAMTANTEPGVEAKCLAAGMNDYLSKPILKNELAAKTRRWLGGDVEREGVIIINKDDGPVSSG